MKYFAVARVMAICAMMFQVVMPAAMASSDRDEFSLFFCMGLGNDLPDEAVTTFIRDFAPFLDEDDIGSPKKNSSSHCSICSLNHVAEFADHTPVLDDVSAQVSTKFRAYSRDILVSVNHLSCGSRAPPSYL